MNNPTDSQKQWLMYRIGTVEVDGHCTDGRDVLRSLMFRCDDMGISRDYFNELSSAVMQDQAAVVIPISVSKIRAAKFVSGCNCPMNNPIGEI